MTESQKEYLDFLKRDVRITKQTLEESNSQLVNRLVGISYGCSESEMDEVVRLNTI
jgi:hypothetical protein